MKLKPKALLFDMDGTLTDPRQLITPEVVEALRSVSNGINLHLVTGSDMGKVEEQIPTPVLLDLFDRVYACNGTRVYNCKLDMDDESLPIEPRINSQSNLIGSLL